MNETSHKVTDRAKLLHQDAELIEQLGGTNAVSRLFEPPLRAASVSGWKRYGIPAARRQTLRLLRPELFQPNKQHGAD